MTEGGLCHFLQFSWDIFCPLRWKTDLSRGMIFCIMIKIMKRREYHAEICERYGGGLSPFHFWRFPFLTGFGAGIFLHQNQRNK